MTSQPAEQPAESSDEQAPETKPSGLRNPPGAVRAAGAITLAIQALVLLLAVLPLRMVAGHNAGWAMLAVTVDAVLCAVLAGLLRHRWAWYAGIALQVLVIATGLFQWAIAIIGLVFGGIWLYVLHLRRTILGRG